MDTPPPTHTTPSDPVLIWELDEIDTPSRHSDVTVENFSNGYPKIPKSSPLRSGHSEDSTIDLPDLGLQEFENWLKEKRRQEFHLPQVGVVWRYLNVVGKTGKKTLGLPNLFSPLTDLFGGLYEKIRGKFHQEEGCEKTILSNLIGYCKPGQMVLVLGKPDCGASTLMKTLGGQSIIESGNVFYNGMNQVEFLKNYKDQIVYSGDEDVHVPFLTPNQTLDITLAFKNPKDTSMKHVVMNWLGLQGCKDQMIGNDWIRGLSGGEKKRLTLAELICTDGTVQVFDQTSKGLDSTFTLIVAQGLRMLTSILEKSTIAYFNQASDNVYNLFDLVCVLNDGKCVYFGPTSQAQGYFERMGFEMLPRQSIPDFLTQVGELHERRIKSGMEFLVPCSGLEFEGRWKSSQEFEDLLKVVEEMKVRDDLEEIVKESRKGKNGRGNGEYVSTWYQQLVIGLRREILMLIGFRQVLLAKFFFNVIVALITGGFTWQMPNDALGSYGKSGAIFFALLISAIQTTADVPGIVKGRPVVYKGKRWTMFHPGLIFLSHVGLDVWIRAFYVTVFSSIFYFMVGFDGGIDKFSIFWFSIFLSAMAFSAMSKALTALSPNLNTALRLNGMWLIPCILFSGYMLPLHSIPPWFVWLYWLNPLAYGFKAMMLNEFTGWINCQGMIVPPYNGVGIEYKSCALPGGGSGVNQVYGVDYLLSRFDISGGIWYNLLAMFGLWMIYLTIGCLAVEYIEFDKSGELMQVYKSGVVKELKMEEETENSVETLVKLSQHSRCLTWKDLNYFVKDRQLLDNVNGYVSPGTMTALMGFTGSGKTTLQDVLCKRSFGKVEGTVFVGSGQQDEDWNLISAFSQQQDLHYPKSTVREALEFCCELRQGARMTVGERGLLLEEILDLLELRDIQHALIGTVESGVGIGLVDRKRLSIGLQLMCTPEFLFLDEPTSALDSYAAFQIVKLLRSLADKGQAILCTIHQPSALLFDYFDNVLFLGPGGKQLYFGPTGSQALEYFERNGAIGCREEENPAEYLLEAANGLRNTFDVDWEEVWKSSVELERVKEVISCMRNVVDMEQIGGGKWEEREVKVKRLNWFKVFPVVLKRFWIGYWRNPSYVFGRIAIVVSQAFFISLAFMGVGNVPNSVLGLTNSMFALFSIVTFGVATIQFVLGQFFEGMSRSNEPLGEIGSSCVWERV